MEGWWRKPGLGWREAWPWVEGSWLSGELLLLPFRKQPFASFMTIFLGAEDNILLHVSATEQVLEMENAIGNSIIHAFHLKRKSASNKQHYNKHYQAKLRNDKAMTSIGKKRFDGAYLARLSIGDVVRIARHHPLPSVLILSLLFFMGVEYTLQMVPPSSQPFDVGFILTRNLQSHCVEANTQLEPGCLQHCFRENANSVYIMGTACRRKSKIDNSSSIHVHMQRDFWLLNPTPPASGFPGIRG